MSKRAEEAALKAYPKENGKVWSSAFGTFEFDKNAVERKGYQEGYEQAEKNTLDRVSDWLRENIQDYLFMSNGEPHIAINGVIEVMRCAINEEDNG